jgi:non-heme chloroperoxidase
MRSLLWGVAIFVLVISALSCVLVFDVPAKPPALASVNEPFAKVDFSDLPIVHTYQARDHTDLSYRVYAGDPGQVVVLIHGSSDDGAGMHPLAKALHDIGATIYVPVLRGHHNSGRSGDIDYIGQLEDDLTDFVAMLRHRHENADISLVGFSSGGGFVLRVIGRPEEMLFDRFILISPVLPPGTPTIRPNTGGWVSLAMSRIVVLAALNQIGVTWLNGLPIVAFATSPSAPNLTSVYSFRLAVDFAAPRDYLAAIAKSKKPVTLLVGGSDELFYADRFAPLLGPARPDLQISIVPDINHVGMILAPDGIAAVRKALLNQFALTK